MKNKIIIIDYGMGNLKNVQNAFAEVGFNSEISDSYKKIENATHVVLPGVGGFKDAISVLQSKGLIDPIKQHIYDDKPFLGVCLGMQLLFETSEEFGHSEGLGILKGKVIKFDEKSVPIIPHIGWNNVEISMQKKASRDDKLSSCTIKEFNGIKNGSFFYFLHSYYCLPEEDITVATCDYHQKFSACVKKKNIFACQFHPEKSHNVGLKMLKNFVLNNLEEK